MADWALPMDMQTEKAIREERWKMERRLYALVGEIAQGADREPIDVMREVTAYRKADGNVVKGVMRPELLSDDRLERSLADAAFWRAQLTQETA